MMATIVQHTIHGTQTVVLEEAVEYNGETFAAGTYEFKFRKQGDWAISIGNDFGNAAANIPVTTTSATFFASFRSAIEARP